MSKFLRSLILSAFLTASVFAQAVNNPASSAVGYAYIGVLSGIPATCSVGTVVFITDATAGRNEYYCTATNTFTQQAGGGAGGANTALSNLAAVSINSALLFQTGTDIGSTAAPGRNLFLFGSGTYGTTYLELTGTPTSTRVLTLPDTTDTLIGKATTDALTNKTFNTAATGNVFQINGTGISAVTGSGSAVLATSPTLVTPTLGAASATTINKVALTQPATGSTLTIADGKTLTASNTLTLAGTDTTTMTFPSTSATIARTDAANTFTGHQTIEGVTSTGATGTGAFVFATSPTLVTPALGAATATSVNGLTITSSTGTFTLTNAKTLSVSNTLTLAGTDSTTMTFPTTSATIARTDAANTFTGHQTIEGVTSTGATGTGNFVFATSPTLTTPTLGVATATSVAVGTSPPTCSPGTGGVWCATEGTGPTAAASVGQLYADSTLHDLAIQANGGTQGIVLHTAGGSAIHQTGKTAAITTSTLCAASAGACNQAGMYHVHWDFSGAGTACSSVTAGSVTFLLTWTDTNAVTHSAVALQMMGQTGAATTAMGGTFPFQTALANESASGDYDISTNGTIIQYATGYTACTTGTGTYQLDAAVTRLQ